VLGSAGAYVVTTFETEPAAFGGLADVSGCCGWLVRGNEREPVPAAPGSDRDFYPAVAAGLAEPDPVLRQSSMPVDPNDAVHVLTVIEAARRSAATGTVVRIGE
jgi:predicted dehydrogenase